MTDRPQRFVLVVGTGWANAAKCRAAQMIGAMLAESGLGLVCGNSSGIDRWVSQGFCAALAERGVAPEGWFVQVALGAARVFQRGGLPFAGFDAPAACRVEVGTTEDWKAQAVQRCDAAVMIGGGRGAMDIADRVLRRGLPVFPLPFMGGLTGHSDDIFRTILKTWDGHPVHGVSRTQFLRLAEPWVVGTGPLRDLLRGTLAQAPDIFVSYRRADAPAAAGRRAAGLGEHFGPRRVFLDVNGIPPSQAWDRTIDTALQACAAGVVVIGRSWLLPGADGRPRLMQDGDVVRGEIAALLSRGKAVFPLLVEGARLPDEHDLPPDLAPLLRCQAVSIGNGDWDATMALLIREIETILLRNERRR